MGRRAPRDVDARPPRRGGDRSVTRAGRALAALTALLFLAGISILVRRTGRPAPPVVERPALRAGALTGCFALDLGPWAPAADPPPRVPGTVLLLADSLDRWGRRHETYRAAPFPDTIADGTPYRWFVRADTLWLVWATDEELGGIALRAGAAGLDGRARVASHSGVRDVTAAAHATHVNCATGLPEPDRASRR